MLKYFYLLFFYNPRDKAWGFRGVLVYLLSISSRNPNVIKFVREQFITVQIPLFVAPLLAAFLVEFIGGDGSASGGSVIGGIAVITAAENV